MATSRTISIRNSHPRLRFRAKEVERVIHTLEAGLSTLRIRPSAIPAGELSLVFLTDPALAKIHADFMDDPTATDVITFEGDQAAGLAGEICVSADTAANYVGARLDRARGRRPATPLQEKFAEELTLYVVHGWLHLCGYDDLQPAKKRRMRAAEKRCLTLLRTAKAIPAFRLER